MSSSRRKPYPTDLTDAEWEQIEPLLPQRRPGDGRGAPRQHDRREILNAILYQCRTGCAWEYLPRDFPPKGTVYDYFREWSRNGTLQRIQRGLRTGQRGRGVENTQGYHSREHSEAEAAGEEEPERAVQAAGSRGPRPGGAYPLQP